PEQRPHRRQFSQRSGCLSGRLRLNRRLLGSVLELDDDLEIALRPDIAGRLDAPPGDVHDRAGNDVGLEIIPKRPLGVGLGHHGDSVPRHLDEKVVELMAVDVALFPRSQPHLPYPNSVVLEHDPRPEVPQYPVVAHDAGLPRRRGPAGRGQARRRRPHAAQDEAHHMVDVIHRRHAAAGEMLVQRGEDEAVDRFAVTPRRVGIPSSLPTIARVGKLLEGTIRRDVTFRDRLGAASDAGYDAISLWGRDYARARSDGHSDAEMRTMLDDHGLVVAEVEPAWWWTPGAAE